MNTTYATGFPELDSECALGQEQIAGFQREGHVLLRGVCSSDEVAEFEPFIARALQAKLREKRALNERDEYGRAFLQTLNLRYICYGCVGQHAISDASHEFFEISFASKDCRAVHTICPQETRHFNTAVEPVDVID